MTRRSLLIAGALSPGLRLPVAAEGQPRDYPAKPIPLTQVDIHDEFWRPRMEANRQVSIWHCLERLKDGGDFNLSKLIEGAAYMLAQREDDGLRTAVNQRITNLLERLGPRLNDPERAVRISGHFYEAAVAWARHAGDRRMLDAAVRAANTITSAYGPGKKIYISEHEGQKIGLIALYRATGDPRYWQLAKFFLDQRGRNDYPRRGEYAIDRTYAQDYAPVVQQKEAVGHCVRATFLYIALADIAALTGGDDYARALDRIWRDATYRKMYITGGIGSIRFHEQFGAPYELPNLSAWCETCAAYGNLVWNHRMFLLHEDGAYIDVMERVLYNAMAAGVSLAGDRFFYQTPLKSFGNYERFDWINTPCCPPNVVRLMASLGSYVYAQSPTAIYVNLYVGSTATIDGVKLVQETRYPLEGDVTIYVDPPAPKVFTLALRIPGWTGNTGVPGLYEFVDFENVHALVTVNEWSQRYEVNKGYLLIDREWLPGDKVELHLPIAPRAVRANGQAKEDRDRIALQRGPLIYCVEWPDNDEHGLNLMIPAGTALKSEFDPDRLGGLQVITGRASAVGIKMREFTAVPYYAWANRGEGEMQVWIGRGIEQTWWAPQPPDPIASASASAVLPKIRTGYNDQNDDLRAVFDGAEPISSADESSLYFRMRPPAGQAAWIEYQLKRVVSVSQAQVYFYDDRRFCRMPAAWRILYLDDNSWKPVRARGAYSVEKDRFNVARFDPVTTTALRLEIEPQTVQYKSGQVGPPDAMFLTADAAWREAGVLEWRISAD
ncbi:MAG TPA: beta-L-arabinofuranosidase domain-containing protein [Bryobacteraceae bacterium]|nr:beta-L-arabinofuranosidase domain-containing protein [Bryobacteraceae bacterium]